jgi:hypothetical protein
MTDRCRGNDRDIKEGKGPLTVSLREPPLPHFVRERKRGFGKPGFLSPGQEGPKDGRDKRPAPARWHAKHDGEGVLLYRWQFSTRHT